MKLTAYEQDILDGKYGEGMAYALSIQVAIGNAFDADCFVPITRAHVALSSQDADLWFAEKMLSKGAKCIIPPTVNPSINLNYLNEHLFEIPEEGKKIVTGTNEAYRKLGAQLTFNCTPYLQQNVPAYGEVIACGRAAAGERFAFSSFANRVLVTVAGEPAFADNLVLDPGADDVAGLGMFEGFAHMGSLVVLAPDLSAERFEAARSALRALADPDEGAVAWDDAPAGFFGARDLDARGLSAQSELAASFVPGGALIGGITHLGEVAGATGWAVRLLGDRAQDLQRALDLVAHLAGF